MGWTDSQTDGLSLQTDNGHQCIPPPYGSGDIIKTRTNSVQNGTVKCESLGTTTVSYLETAPEEMRHRRAS